MPDWTQLLKQLLFQDLVPLKALPATISTAPLSQFDWGAEPYCEIQKLSEAFAARSVQEAPYACAPLALIELLHACLPGMKSSIPSEWPTFFQAAPADIWTELSKELPESTHWHQQLWYHKDLTPSPLRERWLGEKLPLHGLDFDQADALPSLHALLQQGDGPSLTSLEALSGWLLATGVVRCQFDMEAESSLRVHPMGPFSPRPGQTFEVSRQLLLGEGTYWEEAGANGCWIPLDSGTMLGMWKWPSGPAREWDWSGFLQSRLGERVSLEVVIPAFPWQGDFRWKNSLKVLGMGEPFAPEEGAFGPLFGKEVWLEEAIQFASLEVNLSRRRRGHPLRAAHRMSLDRPFGYCLVHESSGFFLQVGRVTRSQS